MNLKERIRRGANYLGSFATFTGNYISLIVSDGFNCGKEYKDKIIAEINIIEARLKTLRKKVEKYYGDEQP